MSDDRPKRDTVHRRSDHLQHVGDCKSRGSTRTKGPSTKQDLYHIIFEFRRKNPRANIPETAFPEPYVLTETENKIIDDLSPC